MLERVRHSQEQSSWPDALFNASVNVARVVVPSIFSRCSTVYSSATQVFLSLSIVYKYINIYITASLASLTLRSIPSRIQTRSLFHCSVKLVLSLARISRYITAVIACRDCLQLSEPMTMCVCVCASRLYFHFSFSSTSFFPLYLLLLLLLFRLRMCLSPFFIPLFSFSFQRLFGLPHRQRRRSDGRN